MIRIEFEDWHDASHLVDALHLSAKQAERELSPILARRLRRIANDLGAELDRKVPIPSARVGA